MKLNEDYEVMPLFATPVYISSVKDSLENELEFVKTLKYNIQQNCNFLTENNKVHLLPEMKKCRDIIEYHLNIYAEKILSIKQRFYLTHSWIAKTNPGQQHNAHYHPNSILSGVLYINANENCSDLKLHKKSFIKEAFAFDYDVENYNIFNSDCWDIPVHSGNIIIFPSHYSHEVSTNKLNEDRIVMSFDTFVKGKFGQNDYYYKNYPTLNLVESQ
jgi:uncharacterized protein (TIGR02466 family)